MACYLPEHLNQYLDLQIYSLILIWLEWFGIRSEFLNIHTTAILGWIVLCYGKLSCTLWNVLQHTWPLPTDAHRPSMHICDNKKYFQTLTNVPGGWGAKLVTGRTTGLDG